jgi:hypothetical protein
MIEKWSESSQFQSQSDLSSLFRTMPDFVEPSRKYLFDVTSNDADTLILRDGSGFLSQHQEQIPAGAILPITCKGKIPAKKYYEILQPAIHLEGRNIFSIFLSADRQGLHFDLSTLQENARAMNIASGADRILIFLNSHGWDFQNQSPAQIFRLDAFFRREFFKTVEFLNFSDISLHKDLLSQAAVFDFDFDQRFYDCHLYRSLLNLGTEILHYRTDEKHVLRILEND